MAATIERAKAEDPRELRKALAAARAEIVALQRSGKRLEERGRFLEEQGKGLARKIAKPVEVQVVKEKHVRRLEELARRCDVAGERAEKAAAQLRGEAKEIRAALAAVRDSIAGVSKPSAPGAVGRAGGSGAGRPEVVGGGSAGRVFPARPLTVGRGIEALIPNAPATASAAPREDGRISKPQQAILDAIAYFVSVAIERPTRKQVALVAKVSSVSSGYEKNVSTLRTGGYIDYPGPNLLRLTESGATAANAPEFPPSQKELHDAICQRLSTPQAATLRVLIASHPRAISRDELAEKSNQSDTSSGFEKNVSTLRSLGLIDYPEPGKVAAENVLFLEG